MLRCTGGLEKSQIEQDRGPWLAGVLLAYFCLYTFYYGLTVAGHHHPVVYELGAKTMKSTAGRPHRLQFSWKIRIQTKNSVTDTTAPVIDRLTPVAARWQCRRSSHSL